MLMAKKHRAEQYINDAIRSQVQMKMEMTDAKDEIEGLVDDLAAARETIQSLEERLAERRTGRR
jgi:predicted  nucleic acid-binding Zn-ribbon protein